MPALIVAAAAREEDEALGEGEWRLSEPLA
jgi:hypothetical protein